MHFKQGHVAFYLMRKLIQKHTAGWQSEIPNITKPQYSVMLAISEKPGIEQTELMEASVATKATLAEILRRMENRGLIWREQGKIDKRRRFVYLTDNGKTLLDDSKSLASQVDDTFMSRLSKAEQAEFIRLLNKMIFKE